MGNTNTNKMDNTNISTRFHCSLSDKQLNWLNKNLDASCHRLIDKKSFITDHVFYTCIKLDKLNNCYNRMYCGMGHEVGAKKIDNKIFVDLFETHTNKLNEFIGTLPYYKTTVNLTYCTNLYEI